MAPETAAWPLRTFVAIPLEPPVLGRLEQAQRRLRDRLPDGGLRCTAVSGLRLTVKFLGPTAPEAIAALAQALRAEVAGVAAFTMHLAAWGAFLNLNRPRVVWVATQGAAAALHRLHQAVRQATAACGFGGNDHPFSPHVTIARVRDGADAGLGPRLRAALAAESDAAPGPAVRVTRVVLFESTLTPGGAHYRELVEAPLGGRGGG